MTSRIGLFIIHKWYRFQPGSGSFIQPFNQVQFQWSLLLGDKGARIVNDLLRILLQNLFKRLQEHFTSHSRLYRIQTVDKNSKMANWTHYSLVEGDFKTFKIRRVNPEDYDKVCEHIAENYLRDEPTSKLLGYSVKYTEEVNLVVRRVLPQGLSFLAEDKETGEIAAVRITFHNTKDVSFDDIKPTTRQAQLFFKLIDELKNLSEVETRYGVDNWAEFLIASTNPKYRSNGLVGELYTRSLAFLKAEGFKHALVIVTNPHTKAATKKRGFEQTARIDYDKFLDFEGKPAFDENDLTPEHFALCSVKTIE